MTSRSLFFNLYKQENKTKIWYPLCLLVLFFVSMIIPLLMTLEEMENKPLRFDYDTKHYFANYFLSPDKNLFLVGATIVCAVFTAYILFDFVFSRQKLDLFHSMPVKRETVFLAKYLCGYTFFMVPFLILIMLTFLIASIRKCFSLHALNNLILFLITISLIYLIVFSMTIICIMLTGNVVVSLAALIVLLPYTLYISALNKELVYKFFSTSVVGYTGKAWKLSPADLIWDLVLAFDEYRQTNIGITYRITISKLIYMLIFIIVYSVIAMLLYKFRKTENAGIPIAFSKTEPVIKFIVVIPLALFAGIFFDSFANSDTYIWFIVGIIIAYFISGILMEIIFRQDFMSGFNHWQHFIVNGVVLLCIILITDLDAFGYNTYIPSRNNMEYMAVSIDGVFDVYSSGIYNDRYHTALEYRMKNVKLSDDNTYNLALRLVENENLNKHNIFHVNKEEEWNSNIAYITYGYHLKNGKDIYRQYSFEKNNEDVLALVSKVFENRDYKIGAIALCKTGWVKDISEIDCETNFDDINIELSIKEKNEFLNLYQNEFMKLKFDEILNEKPDAKIDFGVKNKRGFTDFESGYALYPSFKQTKAFLEERNANFDMDTFLKNATKVTLTLYDFGKDSFPEIEYTDPDKIREIVENSVSYGCNNINRAYKANQSDKYQIDLDVTYYSEDGDKRYRYMTFYNDIPEFVLKDFGLE